MNQTKLYFMSQEQECPISQVDQEAVHMGPILCTRMLEAAHAARSFLLIFPTLSRSQGQAGLFKLDPALLTLQGSPSVPLLCRCQKDLRLFSLAEKRAPFGFQAVPLQLCELGGERNVGSPLRYAAALCRACLLPCGDIKHVACWAVCIFPLPKAS